MVILDYEIIAEIYESARSIVYRGQRNQDEPPIILKLLKEEYPEPDAIARYKLEYEITSRLNLAGVIKAYGLENYNNTLLISLEDFGGQSLKILLNHHKKFTIKEFLEIAIQITDILGEIHHHNIIHKDINPSNIVFNQKTNQIKIIDFGISTVLSQESTTISHPNVIEGTLAYMSPEQTGRMNRVIDYRTDFYSLGATFYELVTGQLPFSSSDAMELVHAHIAKEPIPPHQINSKIPEIISDIILKLLAKNAEDRYQSAYGLKADLEVCLNQLKSQGRIEGFTLGQNDFSNKFQIPQKLYGREQEVEILLSAFERISQGKKEIVLVSGYSGIGKSALVQEIHKPITQARGYFISGKFEQFQRNIPYAALIQAFQSLARQILTENASQIAIWKEKLLAALGTNAQVIVDVIPEIELIIDKQPAVAKLPPTESQNRFNLVFQNFISVFTKKEHPLVIFLDDLQWSDTASLKLIKLLMTKPDSEYLLLIGAYRDNEVSVSHPLMLTLDEIEKINLKQSEGLESVVNYISLLPLDWTHVNHLVADTLKCEQEKVQLLADLVKQKTNGNPFFINEFLKSLHVEGLLRFDFESGLWQWDQQEIQAAQITDNVVELMTAKIQKLSSSTQNVLKLAACIGHQFDLKTLAIVNEKTLAETAAELWEAIKEGLILTLSDTSKFFHRYSQKPKDTGQNFPQLSITYKFLHDRVQQAAYSLISAEAKRAVHLKIGRLILKHSGEDKLFDIVNQMNLGIELITDVQEKYQLARLNLAAGRKAKNSTAYNTALKYFNLAIEMLPVSAWKDDYELTLALYKETAECEYLCANFEEAEKLFDLLLLHSKSNLDKADIYGIRTVQYANQSRAKEAIQVGLEGLKLFGINLPSSPNKFHLLWEGFKAKWNLGTRKVADLIADRDLNNPQKKACMKLLIDLTVPAYYADINLLNLIIMKMVNISLKYGNTEESAYAYVMYGLILGSELGDYKSGYEFGLVGLSINDKFDNIKFKAKVNNQFAIFNAPWRTPLKTVIPFFETAYEAGLNSGDLIFTGYAAYNIIIDLFLQGTEINEFLEASQKYLTFLQKAGHEVILYSAVIWQSFGLSLRGLTTDEYSLNNEYFDEDTFLEQAVDVQYGYALNQFYLVKLELLFIQEDYEAALKNAINAEKNIAAGHGSVYVVDYYFYYSLAIAAVYPELKVEQKQYWKILKTNQKKLKKWADNCAENFLHKYLLVSGEIARISGKHEKAMELYNQAIASARESSYIQDEAIANELAAKFYLARGYDLIAKAYMTEARYGYVKWGANAKVRALEKKYHQFLFRISETSKTTNTTNLTNPTVTSTSRNETLEVLNLTTVMKASQAISSEIVLDKLLAKLMKILIENAGAQKGFLILEKNNSLTIEAEGSVDRESVTVLQSIPVENSHLLSESIINYVARTKESVVLNDASHEDQFINDPYIIANQPKSILCAPLLNQGKLTAILYLENNLITNAFTAGQIEILNVLSSQVAISIENARFYTNLAELNTAYSRFVPRELLDFLHKESIVDVNLGDYIRKKMSILFADIRSFTTLSESMTPEDNFRFINAYLSRMEPSITQNNGFIDKYIGDAIMALFSGGADDAVKAGISMLQTLTEYNKGRKRAGYVPIKIGIGINTGSLMLGTVGGHNRMEGTVISDAVNLASRIEGLTKEYAVSLLISQHTFLNLEDASQYGIRLIDQVKVKGKSQAVAVFEVFDGDPPDIREGKLATATAFEEGLLLYKLKKFDEAKKLFESCLQRNPKDKVARIYLSRCH